MKKPIKPKKFTKVEECIDIDWHTIEEVTHKLSKYNPKLKVELDRSEAYIIGSVELSDEEFAAAMDQYNRDLKRYNQYLIEKKRAELKKLEEEVKI